MAEIEEVDFEPNYAVPPGETLRETLESLGMRQAELAQRTGRPKKTINEIIKGKTAITAETAIQLERTLGVPASFWNNLERNYRETLARLREEEQLQSQIKWVQSFPVASLVKKGWLPKLKSDVEKLRALLNFFGVAGIKEWQDFWASSHPSFRKSFAFRDNTAAVSAWLRRGEVEAVQVPCNPYKESAFLTALKKIQGLTNESPNLFEPAVKALCAEAGVVVVFVPELPGTHLYGATRWISAYKALIQLSLRGKSNDHLWFTFFHEAGHIVLHGKKDIFIEARNEGCRGFGDCEKEREADLFALNLLIPQEEFHAFVRNRKFSEADIGEFAEEIGIAPGIVVGRLQHEKLIPFSRENALKKRLRFGGGQEKTRMDRH